MIPGQTLASIEKITVRVEGGGDWNLQWVVRFNGVLCCVDAVFTLFLC